MAVVCKHAVLGVMQRDVRGSCVLCRRANTKKWRAENPDKAREYSKAYRKAHPKLYRESYRKWSQANPEKVQRLRVAWIVRNPEKDRASQRKSTQKFKGVVWGPGQSEDSLLRDQRGLCAICECDLTLLVRKHVHTDHDHSVTDGSPNVRGMLCAACNISIGRMKDRPEVLRAAADYLERFVRTKLRLVSNG